ncbi:hypothetical protein BG005_010291 [Podila minutissima]|nr:hypothetical protein BG005_010291 [Podila minutissima]
MFKIVLYFPNSFGPRDKHFINFLPTDTVVTSKPDPKPTDHLNSKRSVELMEQLTDEETMEVYVCQLSHYYDELIQDAERYRPIKCFMTRWHSDPFTQGSDTSIPIDAHLTDIEAFEIPVGTWSYTLLSSVDDIEEGATSGSVDDGNKMTVSSLDDPSTGHVFFAGEHTSQGSILSIHGAIMSGRYAAAKILN